jgi:hypothetical protein
VLSRVLRSAMMVICPGQGSWPYGLGLGSNELIDKVSAGEHSEARFEFEEVIPDEFCARRLHAIWSCRIPPHEIVFWEQTCSLALGKERHQTPGTWLQY